MDCVASGLQLFIFVVCAVVVGHILGEFILTYFLED
jgi:ribosomal protein S19